MAFSYLSSSLLFATLAPSENAQAIVDPRHCDEPGEIKAAFSKSLVSLLVVPFKFHDFIYTLKIAPSINAWGKWQQARLISLLLEPSH
jgi:hypothetical protein